MQSLTRAARRETIRPMFSGRTSIIVHATYAPIEYVHRHLYGIWGITKSGALCFNYWPDHLIGRDCTVDKSDKDCRRGNAIISPSDDPQVLMDPWRRT